MSATFLADGRRAFVLGHNLLLTRRFGSRRWVHAGAIGPVPVSEALAASMQGALDAIVDETGLRGLGSLDVIVDEDGAMQVLECNPRPSATLELYRDRLPGGPMLAHWQACREATLPTGTVDRPDVSGTRVVYARRPLRLSTRQADALASEPDLHDLPSAGQAFDAGDPLCSLHARGHDANAVRAQMARRRRQLLESLEAP